MPSLHYGVLILNSGQTYGRLKNKLLYKCVPEDKALPRVVLVPYHDRDQVQFSKDRVNKYITFTLNDTPVGGSGSGSGSGLGTLRSVLGNVNMKEDYLQYRLQSQQLGTTSLKSMTEALKPCGSIYPSSYLFQGLEDRSKLEIYSIDPAGCQDIDDAIGLRDYSLERMDGMVTIYIANVPLLLDRLNLWSTLSERTSTIYLPGDQKIPMLPPLLSENWCSLKAQHERLAFAMDVLILKGQIINVAVNPAVIKVEKNCAYDDPVVPVMMEDLLQITIKLNESYPFVNNDLASLKKDDQMHKLVEYWMIFMNYECAKLLVQKDKGIFRQGTLPAHLQEALQGANPTLPSAYQHLYNVHPSPNYFLWTESVGGKGAEPYTNGGKGAEPPAEPYTNGGKGAEPPAEPHTNGGKGAEPPAEPHTNGGKGAEPPAEPPAEPHTNGGKGAEPPTYTHITSPIRRLVDLLNMTFLQEEVISDKGKAVAEHWLGQLDYINQQTKATRKIQNEALLLSLYEKDNGKVYEGCVLEKNRVITRHREQDSDLTKYSVYISELKLWSSFKSHKSDIEPYSFGQFFLFIFLDEVKRTRKIRLQLVL